MSAFSVKPEFIDLQNYAELFKDNVFYIALKNNVLFAVVSVLVQCVFGLFLAILLESKLTGKMSTFYRVVYFIPAIMSVSAVGMLWSFIYEPSIGLLNRVLEMIGRTDWTRAWLGDEKTAMMSVIMMSQWQNMGYITLLLVVAIQKIPEEYYEAAEIDGANALAKAWYITVPMVRDMLVVGIVITVTGAFKVFTEVYVTTLGGPGQASHVLGTYLYLQGFINNRAGYASAIGVIAFIITFVLSILQIRISNTETTGAE
jgi:raffinose/stachyose/melibiose transport system permease protein